MSTIVTRAGKGSPLTNNEVDANFTNLNTDKVENNQAVSFTTITGQTEVLRGTGQNLWLQSANFGTTWATLASSIPALNSTTAPDGTLTADTFTIDGTTAQHYIQQSATYVAGITYTFSVYVKKNTSDFIQMGGGSGQFGTNAWANFNINTGVLGTVGSAATATITSAGNNWYRCTLTATCSTAGSGNSYFAFIQSATDARLPSFAGNSTDSLFLWGGQLEIASSVGTYTATTTTAVYGTPTLSFSGVSTLGLESNGALFLQPAGTGAIQAQATTSTTAGGNARGANAVDWQTKRSLATQVASGLGSVICGGEERNTASGQQSFVGTGYNNNASAYGATIVTGVNNTASGLQCFIGAGPSHTIGSNGAYNVIVGGNQNTANGRYNFIGAGTLNSGTSGSTVTTQATTTVTSGSTAVTLSGSNANIKVGQLITGTGIIENTYVAAISGTSLTLSQNANATGTPTLSFFTPHGVVVGGGNNQATGAYSFIGGGGDAGTAANRNVASGDWSFVGGGVKNVASGVGSVVCGGGTDGSTFSGNTASGILSTIGGGRGHVSSSQGSFVGGGFFNTANSQYSTIAGGVQGTTRSIEGNFVFPACVIPIANTSGITQSAVLVLARQTTDATPTVLCSNPNAAGTTNQVILPNNSAYYFKATVIAGVTGGGNTKAWTIEGAIKRGATAASTTIVGTVTTTLLAQDAGASSWAITATADTTNGGLALTFTGQASTTIRAVAKVETTEMTY